MAPKLGYWPRRCFASPIRFLLHYTGTKFEDFTYTFGEDPNYYHNDWVPVKFTLGLDFPNLPYYIDGDFKLTQSTAILRYLARKHGLVGTTDEMIAKMEMVEQQLIDLRMKLIRLCYSPKFDQEKDEYIKNFTNDLKLLAEFLGDKKWFFGDKVTYVDFMAYDVLDWHRYISSDCLEKFPNLKGYVNRFESLPAILKYMNSKSYIKWPLFTPKATFGGN